MPPQYEYDEWVRSQRQSPPPRRDRDYSPDRHSAVREETRTVFRDETRTSPRDSFVREVMTLAPPAHDARPRSVPPVDTQQLMRRRSPSPDTYYHSRSPSRDRARSHRRDSSSSSKRRNRSRERSESPLSRARNALEDNFTGSGAGIGASLLGAVAGGWAARQAGEGLSRHYHKKEGSHGRRRSDADKEDERIRLASTLLGAAIGGLGANALANRYEDNREHNRERSRGHPQALEGRREIEDRESRYDDDRREGSRHGSHRGHAASDYEETYEETRRRDDRYDDNHRDESRYDSRQDSHRRRDDRYDDRRYDDRY